MSNTRRFSTISKRIRSVLDPSNPDAVWFDHKVSQYYTDIFTFLSALNAHPGFDRDGMRLGPADVVDDPQVSDINVAVLANYLRRDWVVN